MQSKNTRIAYLKRMLKRIESEQARLQKMVALGSLAPPEAEMGMELLVRDRAKLQSELQALEAEIVDQRP